MAMIAKPLRRKEYQMRKSILLASFAALCATASVTGASEAGPSYASKAIEIVKPVDVIKAVEFAKPVEFLRPVTYSGYYRYGYPHYYRHYRPYFYDYGYHRYGYRHWY